MRRWRPTAGMELYCPGWRPSCADFRRNAQGPLLWRVSAHVVLRSAFNCGCLAKTARLGRLFTRRGSSSTGNAEACRCGPRSRTKWRGDRGRPPGDKAWDGQIDADHGSCHRPCSLAGSRRNRAGTPIYLPRAVFALLPTGTLRRHDFDHIIKRHDCQPQQTRPLYIALFSRPNLCIERKFFKIAPKVAATGG